MSNPLAEAMNKVNDIYMPYVPQNSGLCGSCLHPAHVANDCMTCVIKDGNACTGYALYSINTSKQVDGPGVLPSVVLQTSFTCSGCDAEVILTGDQRQGLPNAWVWVTVTGSQNKTVSRRLWCDACYAKYEDMMAQPPEPVLRRKFNLE